MSSQEIVVDDFLAPKRVRIGETSYKVPGDIPTPLYLRVTEFGSEMEAANSNPERQAELVEDLYDEVLSLFRVYQPDLQTLPIGLVSMVPAINKIYSGPGEPAEDAAVPPPPRRRSSGTPTSRRRK